MQLRVPSYSYTGVGNSTSKKDAQANAAQDFCSYLVRLGEMNQAEVPSVTTVGNIFFFGGGIYSIFSVVGFLASDAY